MVLVYPITHLSFLFLLLYCYGFPIPLHLFATTHLFFDSSLDLMTCKFWYIPLLYACVIHSIYLLYLTKEWMSNLIRTQPEKERHQTKYSGQGSFREYMVLV